MLNLGSKTLGIIENNGAIKGTIDTKNILRKKYTIFDQYIPLHIISWMAITIGHKSICNHGNGWNLNSGVYDIEFKTLTCDSG